MKLTTLLDLIDNGSLQLPEFQRGYVWNRDQVRGLMRSLYRGYPVGGLLIWSTRAEGAPARGSVALPPGYVDLLLDGQQRITSLYGILRGKPPAFFEGNAQSFTGLRFHLEEESFEFYTPAKMRNDPLWVDVGSLMRDGIGPTTAVLNANQTLAPRFGDYVQRLSALVAIKEVDFQEQRITGEDKTIDVVVEIFDRVNSGGTKLSKADIALAKVCAQSPEARGALRAALARWATAGFEFRLEWLLRVVNAVATGEALFSKLASATAAEFASALQRSEKIVDTLLNNISSHLGLDHDRVLSGRYAFAVMARYLDKRGGKLTDAAERDRLLHWYVHSFLWARYVGASETLLNQDLEAADAGGIAALTDALRQSRGGDLTVRPSDFAGYSLGARFYPLLYLMTRVHGARDLWGGAPTLSAHMLGKLNTLQVHHIFPKARLYEHGYQRGQVNAIANFCFLTQETNLWVLDRAPRAYFQQVEETYPGALSSQWIPTDPALWEIDRYPDFLEARRALLAAAANEFLNSLLATPAGPAVEAEPVAARTLVATSAPDGAESEFDELVAHLVSLGYAEPERDREILDPSTHESVAVAELAWPDGLQEGLGEPVVLDLELTEGAEAQLSALGYRVFPDPQSLKRYADQRAREASGDSGRIEAALAL